MIVNALAGVPLPWRGALRLGEGWAVFCGEAGDNAWHAHPALQLTVGLRGPVTVWWRDSEPMTAAGVVIGTALPHRVTAHDTPVLSVYLDGQSRIAGAIARACAQEGWALDGGTVSAVCAALGDPPDGAAAAQALLRQWHALSAPPPAPSAATQRVRAVIRAIAAAPQNATALTLPVLAARAAVSPSHFATCLRVDTGLALRPTLRWMRLQRAAAAALAGATLTQAAHHAGFADAAHLTRTFRRHFGLAPSAVFHALRATDPSVRSSPTP